MLIQTASASFTRPNDTTAYASGDLVANSTTAGSVTPLQFAMPSKAGQGQTIIIRLRMSKTGTSVTNASFRVHMYESSPTPSNGDNGAWLTDKAASYLGNIDVTTDKAFTDGAAGFGAAAAGAEMRLRLSSGSTIFGLVEARGAYTPAAQEVFTITFETLDAY